jgi:hypothetical protein
MSKITIKIIHQTEQANNQYYQNEIVLENLSNNC